MKESWVAFGQKLAQERIRQGVSLQDLAVAIKVRGILLQDFEAGRFEGLPPAVFVEGYLKAYARQLGMDPDPLVAEFRDITEAAPLRVLQPFPPQVAPGPRPGRSLAGWLSGFALSAVLLLSAYYLAGYLRRAGEDAPPRPQTGVPAHGDRLPQGAPPPPAGALPEGASQSGDSGSTGSAAGQPEPPATGSPAVASGTEGGSPANASPQPLADGTVPGPGPGPGPGPSPSPAAAPDPAPSPEAPPPGDLAIVASADCWCEVWADGQRKIYRQMAAGERLGIRGERFKVSLGNAGAVALYFHRTKVPLPGGDGRVVKNLSLPGGGEGPAP